MILQIAVEIKNRFLRAKESLKHLVFSVLLAILSIGLFLSFISYNPIDLIETKGQLNFLGAGGAGVANFFLQYFGFAAYFLLILLLRWSFIILKQEPITHYKLKLLSGFACVLLLCFLLSGLKPYEFKFYNPLGGYVGFLFSSFLVETKAFIPVYICSFILFIALAVFCLELYKIQFFINIFSKLKFKRAQKMAAKPEDKPKPAPRLSKVTTNTGEELVSFKPPVLAKPQTLASKVSASMKYVPPSISLLSLNSAENQKKNQKNLALTKSTEKDLTKALADFGIEATIKGVRVGPVISMYEIEPKAGIRAARIIGLADDIARALKAKSARISIIPGNSSLAIEIPNAERETVFLRELLDSPEYNEAGFNIPIALGKSIAGDNIIVDLTTMPHLLVAGTTGSGKSVGVNAMLLSILYKLSPTECQFIMIDPKMLELSVYNDIPHLLTPVITEPERAVMALKWLTLEMERRYRRMSAFSVRNIFGYNEAILKLKASDGSNAEENTGNLSQDEIRNAKKMPFIVVIIDEMADLMITAGKVIEGHIQRLAQMARAAGIHVIMATQRPSVDVITGVIKANFPTRISYQVSSKIDSRTILGTQGAEGLLGKGDMLYMQAGSKTYRIHAPFASDNEVNNIVSALKKTYAGVYDNLKVDIFEEVAEEGLEGERPVTGSAQSAVQTSFREGIKSDEELYLEAVEVVILENKPSISYVQRRLKVGYNKAANLIERMEKEGIVSQVDNTGKRMLLKKNI